MPDKIVSKKNKMANNGTLAKTLFYDLICKSRRPVGLSLVDANDCYDRIAHAILLLVCQLFGVPQEAIGLMLRTIQEMIFFLHTTYRYLNTATGLHVDIKTQGLCQRTVPPPLDGR
jgi:hypothetical protein